MIETTVAHGLRTGHDNIILDTVKNTSKLFISKPYCKAVAGTGYLKA